MTDKSANQLFEWVKKNKVINIINKKKLRINNINPNKPIGNKLK